MEIAEIQQKKTYGDIRSAAEMVGISKGNARMALKRPNSKYHQQVVDAMTSIITVRELLFKPNHNSNG